MLALITKYMVFKSCFSSLQKLIFYFTFSKLRVRGPLSLVCVLAWGVSPSNDSLTWNTEDDIFVVLPDQGEKLWGDGTDTRQGIRQAELIHL